MDRLQRNRHRHEDLTGGRAGVRVRRGGSVVGGDGGAMEASRRGRFYHHDGPGAAAVPVVDQAGCTARTCRSCVAVTLADAIALGCCPCAVVSLLGLAFVKAPLALARRCLRRRRRELRHKKRVRDMDGRSSDAKAKCRRSAAAAAGCGCGCGHEALDAADAASKGEWWGLEADARGEAAAMRARASNSSSAASGRLDAEKVWMEMYQVGHWGFGRLSISVTPSPPPPPPVRPGRSPDGGGDGEGGRKDVDLRCES